MKKQYKKPFVQRLTMVPAVAVSTDSEETLLLSLGWDNEGEV